MASTPIYNWPTPDNTDLVKNGALAIRTLGNAIDTTVDTMIPETIFAAKGDLLGASANDTPAVLTVGANGETLVADSSTSTGLRYTAGNVSDNPVLNSSMQVWQRGTSFAIPSTTITYTADRWYGYRGATGLTISRQTTSDTTNLPFIQYCLRMQRDSGNTSTGRLQFGQSWESINSIPFAGKTVTYSFYARKGANYSGGSVDAVLLSGTGTDQNQVNGFTGGANVAVVSSSLTTTWTRYSATGTVATNATQLATYFQYDPTGTAGAADFIEVTGVQVDVGSVALPYRSTTGTIQGELAACQRYYYRITGTNNFSNICPAFTDATNNAVTTLTFPVEMRVAPTSIDFSNIRVTNFSGAAAVTSASVSSAFNGKNNTGINLGVAGTPLTAFAPFVISCNNNAAGYLGMSAEL